MLESAASLWRRLTHQPRGRPTGAPIAEPDRRVWVRRHVSAETRVVPTSAPDEASVSARIVDLSPGGVKLLIGRAFQPGDLLTLETPAQAGEASVAVLACVAHSQPEGDGEWSVGCRFSAELSAADLADLGAARARPASPDSRNWSRFRSEATAVYQVVSDGEEVRREARVLNLSPAGVALSVDHEVRAGALLSAELHAPDGRPVVTILACVVHVTVESSGQRVLGCNFIQELSEQDLQRLA